MANTNTAAATGAAKQINTTVSPTVLTQKAINNAKSAIAAYKTACETDFETAKAAVVALLGNEFLGDANSGYQQFYNTVVPAVSDNLYGDQSIVSLLNGLVESMEQVMIQQLDPQLGQVNTQSAGGTATGGVQG